MGRGLAVQINEGDTAPTLSPNCGCQCQGHILMEEWNGSTYKWSGPIQRSHAPPGCQSGDGHPGAERRPQSERREELGYTQTDGGDVMPSAHYSRVKQSSQSDSRDVAWSLGTLPQPGGRPGRHQRGLRAHGPLPPPHRRLPGGQAEPCWLQPHHAHGPGHPEEPG